MSESPDERVKNSKKFAKDSIEQTQPVGKQDPTDPVYVSGKREGKQVSSI